MHSAKLFTGLLALSVTTAWPWPSPVFQNIPALHHLENFFARQPAQATATNSNAPTSTQQSVVVTQTPTNQPSAGSKVTSGPVKTATDATGSQNSKTTAATKTTLAPISPNDPAGAVSMINPAVSSGAQYYAIGNWVTFAWNYTYLLRDPKAVDVLAALSQSNANGVVNTATYTLTQNMSFVATPTLLWDTNDWTSSATPLAPGTYTLIIYDAESAITAAPQAGYLDVYDQYTFGMYTPAAYTALAPEYQCATCNSAITSMERMTVSFLLGMAGVTIVSFTWFASGSGILF